MGSGPNAGILHYQGNDEAFGDRQVLLIDASCEWQLYAADITRTMPLNKKKPGHWPSLEAKAIYRAVEKVQEECIRLLRPGKRFIDVNWHAIHMTIDALLHLGLLKGDHMEIFHTGTVGAFFPHGLGHHIGLEVHDIMPSRREHNDSTTVKTDIAAAYEIFAKTASPKHQPLPGYHAAHNFSLSPSTSTSSF
jgi:Xaa-Pro dipeptidase